MAKRKRLTPPLGDFLGAGAPEVKSALSPPPIAQVAGEAAASAALREVSTELAQAREQGRLVQRIALDHIEQGWLVRDRLDAESGDDAEMEALVESLRRHGQRTPIEVAEIEAGRFGLISGWRRLTALRRLHAETGEERFGAALAFLRRPEAAEDAYVAMVEENEIRLGLSYFERARIVARAVEAGVFPTEKVALNKLFGTVSRAKRCKIGSFLRVYRALGEALSFPEALAERSGLALARALEADAEFAPRLRARLQAARPQTAEAEQALLRTELDSGKTATKPGFSDESDPPAPASPQTAPHMPPVAAAPSTRREIRPGLFIERREGRAVLSGPGLGPGLLDRLENWLRREGEG